MSEELQSLLEKIQEDGVKKADTERDKIITAAKEEAAKIKSDAEKKAAEIVKKAEEEAKRNEERAASTIRQAARDAVIALNAELRERLETVVKECVGDAMTPKMMGGLILEMYKKYLEHSSKEPEIHVLLNEKDIAEMEKLIKGSLVENLKHNPEISLAHDFSAGLKIGFKDSDIFFDFSDEALSEVICAYVGPRLAGIIKDDKS